MAILKDNKLFIVHEYLSDDWSKKDKYLTIYSL
jgi:hypothetical protein